MSPARLPVEEGGGLSEAQIDLRILESKQDFASLMGVAMQEHVKNVEEQFALHEKRDAIKTDEQKAVVSKRLDDQDEKLDTILAAVKENHKLVSENTRMHEGYHQGDLDFRRDIVAKTDSLAKEVALTTAAQIDLNSKLNLIQWLVMFCKGISWSSDKAVKVADRGGKLWAALAGICSSVSLVWLFFRDNGMLSHLMSFLHHTKK